MISITNKSQCCGCNACVQCCPKQCIVMYEDEEGFLYPHVDSIICINCGLCDKICPILNQNKPKRPLQTFAAKNNNDEQRLRSSSGGIFILFAEHIIRQGGVVFGARFDRNWEVEHCSVETIEELESLMRSKYMQSRIGNTYKKAEQFLKDGRQVLFVGTSCQIAGLRKFLRKDYDNLFAVDFICHGVPSPGVWRRYLEEIRTQALRSKVAGKNTVLLSSQKSMPVITDINFREKQQGGYGWKKYGFVVCGKSPFRGDRNTVLLSTVYKKNPYMKAFLINYILRPSCYECPAKSGKSYSDLTLADFWGLSGVIPQVDDDKGVSLLFVNTKKTQRLLNQLDMKIIPVDYEIAVRNNIAYIKAASVPDKRSDFWMLFNKNMSVSQSLSALNKKPLGELLPEIILLLMKLIKHAINKIKKI